MSAKPIVVVYFNPSAIPFGKENPPYPVVKKMNDIARTMFPDYHTLAVPTSNHDGTKEDIYLQVFYEKDSQEINTEELLKKILEEIK